MVGANLEYDKNNIFAKILRGEAPCIKVYENENTLAFMDIMPQMDGHVLVIPKQPAISIYDLNDEYSLACVNTVKLVGQAVEKAVGSKGITVFQHNGKEVGQTVPHFHFHILPGSIFDAGAIKGHALVPADPKMLNDLAAEIRACIEGIGDSLQ